MQIYNEYPWPPSALSPNARLHWTKRNPVKAKYREGCAKVTRHAELVREWLEHEEEAGVSLDTSGALLDTTWIGVAIQFVPPDRRWRDVDNLVASCKPLLDGMCRRLGVNDRMLWPLLVRPPRGPERDARVEVTLYFGELIEI